MAKEPSQLDWDKLRRGHQQNNWYIACTVLILYFTIMFIDARINAHVLLSLNERRLERFGVSLGFQFAIMSVIEDLVCS